MPFKFDDFMKVVKTDNPTYERVKESELHELVELLKAQPLKATRAEIIEEMEKVSAEKWEKYAKTRAYLINALRDMVKGFSDVQFIGYAVHSSGVKNAKTVQQWWIQGDYCGTPPDAAKNNSEEKDVDNRLMILSTAVATAAKAKEVEKSKDGLKVFVSPEFFFRGTRGAYEMDDYLKVVEGMAEIAKKYDDSWVFCFGSIIGMSRDYEATLEKLKKAYEKDNTAKALIDSEEKRLVAELKKKSADELPSFRVVDAIAKLIQDKKLADPKVNEDLECYNVVIVLQGSKPQKDARAIVKEFRSGIDFVVWDSKGLNNVKSVAFLEKVKHIPSEPSGDGKEVQFQNYDGRGVFKMADVTFGVEICLDHLQKRLKASNAKVQIQLVPSCGMDLKEPSMVVVDGGLAFNVDGMTPHTMLWQVEGGKKKVEIEPIAEVPVAAPLAPTHLGSKDGGKLHIYPQQFIPDLK